MHIRTRLSALLLALGVWALPACINDLNCDNVVTECFDVCDTYCNAFGCWDECFTDCDDRCVATVNNGPVAVSASCTADVDCARGYQCASGECRPVTPVGVGLCEACATAGDCREEGALCLLLTESSDSGFCGRTCNADADCPADYGCRSAGGTLQCIPLDLTCSDQVPLDPCTTAQDCRIPFICVDGFCGPPELPCTTTNDCSQGLICSEGTCKPAR